MGAVQKYDGDGEEDMADDSPRNPSILRGASGCAFCPVCLFSGFA